MLKNVWAVLLGGCAHVGHIQLVCMLTRPRPRLRQFPLYSKEQPPPVLEAHFKAETFKKSQVYGKDKAKFSLVSGILKQVVDSAFMQFGLVAWSWSVGGWIVGKLGYGPEYEVSVSTVPFS